MAGSSVSQPEVTIQLSAANIVTAFQDRNDIIIGQIGDTGTAVDGQLYTDVQALTETEYGTLFDNDTDLFYKIKNFISANGYYTPLSVIGKTNSGGDPAESTIVMSGASTADGTYTISVVDERRWSIEVDVPSGTDNEVTASLINTAISTFSAPPFSNAVATDTVTLTAVDKGTIGNFYGIRIEGEIAGLTLALTGWAGGLTDPTLTGILDPIDGTRYTGLQWPEAWYSFITIPVDEFDSRFNTSNTILDGVVFTGSSQTFADNKVKALLQNSQSLVIAGNNLLTDTFDKAPAILQPADWAVTYFMGVRARRNTTDAPIASYVVSTNPNDTIGGSGLASLPYANTPMSLIPVTPPVNQYSNTEQTELQESGVTIYGVNPAGNEMIMGEVVTTWTTDSAGNPNVSFHWLNYVDTGSACREIFFNTLRSTFAQSRATEGDLIPGYSMSNTGSVEAECKRIYKQLSELALTQAGSAAEVYFSSNLSVTLDISTGVYTISSPLPIVVQARAFIYSLQFSFSISE